MSASNITACRLCKSENLEDVIDLGEQYITSRFPLYGDWSTPKTSVTLCKCEDCHLLQLRQTTFASEIYEQEYGYRSGISNTMCNHLKQYAEEILSIHYSRSNDLIVVDIGSNDATMLKLYPSDKVGTRIGVDPTGVQFLDFYNTGNVRVELIPTYFTRDNF